MNELCQLCFLYCKSQSISRKRIQYMPPKTVGPIVEADASRPEDALAATTLTAHERVSATSNEFLGHFVNLWLFVGLLLWVYQFFFLPMVQYSGLMMLGTGLLTWVAIRFGRLRLARYLLTLPLCASVALTPLLADGVRMPVLANIPLLLLLVGWLLGRRTMSVIAVLFGLTVFAYWLAEAQGWFVLAHPLRSPDVWIMVWLWVTTLTAIAVWLLMANYESNFRQELDLRDSLATALQDAESAFELNQRILHGTPLPMAVYSANGQCLEANDAFVQLLGTSREQLLSLHNFSIWKDFGLLEDCQAVLASNTPRRREIHDTTLFGKDMLLECRILPMHLKSDDHLLIQFIDLSERKRIEEELRQLAFHDALTRLPNRRLLLDRLQHAINNCKRSGSHVAVLFLDLNKFKQLNDTHGHEAGDLLLKEVASRIQQCVREADTVARFGGDEFVVLLEDLGADANQAGQYAVSVTQKLRHALAREYLLGDIHHYGSASVGIKLVEEGDNDPDHILRDADAAMYEEKKNQTL